MRVELGKKPHFLEGEEKQQCSCTLMHGMVGYSLPAKLEYPLRTKYAPLRFKSWSASIAAMVRLKLQVCGGRDDLSSHIQLPVSQGFTTAVSPLGHSPAGDPATHKGGAVLSYAILETREHNHWVYHIKGESGCVQTHTAGLHSTTHLGGVYSVGACSWIPSVHRHYHAAARDDIAAQDICIELCVKVVNW